MYEDATFNIINVGDNRINRFNDRFVRYLLTGGRSKLFLISFINAALMFEGGDRIVDLELIPVDIHGEDSKTKLSVLYAEDADSGGGNNAGCPSPPADGTSGFV